MKSKFSFKKPVNINELIQRLIESEETTDSIKYKKVDTHLIDKKEGHHIFTFNDSDRPYPVLLEKINEGVITLSKDGTVIFSNSKFAGLLNLSQTSVIGSSILKWIDISDLNDFTSFLNENKENESVELNLFDGNISYTPVSILFNTIYIENSEPITCLVVTDLSENIKNHELIDSEKLSRSVIEQAWEPIVVCDAGTKIIRGSKGAEVLAGESLLNQLFDSVFLLKDSSNNSIALHDIIKKQLPLQTEVQFLRKDGAIFNLIFNISALSDKQGKILAYIITLVNITSHIASEEKISASLKEKTVLLKEIHHRVKNNLQIVSSLLNIQATYIKDPAIKQIFSECQQRINSIALIHRKLYESKSLSEINITEYFHDLVGFLSSTYLFNSKNIIINPTSRNYYFPIESAIPLGLIINELITNCIKHAFKDRNNNEIIINIYSEDEKNLFITIKDNGVGIPKNYDIFKTETLGMQLVFTLIDQLNGSVELIRSDGTQFKLTVPLLS